MKMADKLNFIVNDRDRTFETDKITEEVQISIEDKKYRKLSDLASSCLPFDSRIDINFKKNLKDNNKLFIH